MAKAPTPPPHVPVNYLKAGAADAFSVKCQELLAKAGYTPEMFGTYDHVAKQIQASKKKIADWKAWNKTKKGPRPEAPSAADKYLAGCQSGHMVQNAVFQNERDNPCHNTPPGCYDMGMAPCMPHHGMAGKRGTEHYMVSRHEEGSGNAAGKPGQKYPGDKIDADADDRTKKVVESQDKGKGDKQLKDAEGCIGKDRMKEADKRAETARKAREASAKEQAASGAKPKDPAKSGVKGAGGVDGNTAEECINNFRKAGMAAMREAIIKDQKANEAKAKENAPKIPGAEKETKDAKKKLDKFNDDHDGKKLTKKQKAEKKALANDLEKKERAESTLKKPGCLAKQAKDFKKNGLDPNDTPNGVVPSNAKDTGVSAPPPPKPTKKR